jgi:hypothetical protein
MAAAEELVTKMDEARLGAQLLAAMDVSLRGSKRLVLSCCFA